MKTLDAGRLALRVEGEMWNAYWYPRHDTTEGGVFLASTRLNFVVVNAERKKQFMAFCRDVYGDACEAAIGRRPVWSEPEGHPAAEHERAGTA